MRILLITNYFPPEIGAASHLFFDLATELKKRGHEVYVVTGFPRYHLDKNVYDNYKRIGKKIVVENKGIKIYRVYVPYLGEKHLYFKGIEHLILPFYFNRAIKEIPLSEIAYICSPPISLVFLGSHIKKVGKVYKVVMGIQDIFPQNAIDLGTLKNPILIKFFESMENRAYKIADHLTVHSEGNAEFLINNKHVSPKKITVIPNWVDTNFLKPLPKNNKFLIRWGLNENDFVVSFAGTMGISQDMEIILFAAKSLINFKDIKFLIVGEGFQREFVENYVKENNLKNVILLPMQPRNVYPWILASSDVSLVTLKSNVETPVVPSKILSIMASQRAIIAALPKEGDAAKLINNSNSGIVVDAEDKEKFIQAIVTLYRNRELKNKLAQSGRNYVENNLSKPVVIDKLISLFEKILRGGN